MMTTNLFVIANVKQLRTGGSFRILPPFLRTSWGVGVLNSANFNNFHNRVEFWHDFGGPSEFRGGGGWFEHPNPPPPPRNVTEKSCTENKNTRYVKFLFCENRTFYEIMWENILESIM
jgi:hypothetical protein